MRIEYESYGRTVTIRTGTDDTTAADMAGHFLTILQAVGFPGERVEISWTVDGKTVTASSEDAP
jgi:hypothetical protein